MNRNLIFIAILYVQSFINTQAADYYVSNIIGVDSNSGTSSLTPFGTLNKAKQVAFPGDTVHIMNGTYRNNNYGNGKLTNNGNALQITRSGNAVDGNITFKNYAGHNPKIQFDGSGGINLASGVSYIVIDGLEVQGPSVMITYADAFAKRQEKAGIGPLTGHSDNYYNGNGIYGWGPHNNIIIRNCKVYETPSSGIRFNRSDHVLIEDCMVSKCCWWTSSATSGVVFAQTEAASGDNGNDVKMIFRRNIVSEVWNRIPFYVASIPANGNPPRPDYGKPEQDYILDGQGIYVTRSDPAYEGTFLFENNICVNNGKNGINFDHSNSATAIIRHNTMYHNGSHNFIQTEHDGPNRVAGIAATGVASATIVNNIVVVRPPAKEVTRIMCRADSNGDLNDTFFELERADGRCRFWYNVNGNGVAPADLGGGVYAISIFSGDSSATIASRTRSVIHSVSGLTATLNGSEVEVSDDVDADRKNVTDSGATGHTFSVMQQGMGVKEYKAITVWDNSPVTANFNLITNGSYGGTLTAGANDIEGNPLLIAPSEDLEFADFNLQKTSPAVNSASAVGNHLSTQDFNEADRPMGGSPDRGAFESNHSSVNLPPFWKLDPFTRPDAKVGTSYLRYVNFNGEDPEGEELTYQIVSGPPWLIMTNASLGKIEGNPHISDRGLNTFVVSVSDSFNPPVLATMTIEVLATNLEIWAGHYSLESSDSGLSDDPNSDGKTNAYHFGLDTNPLANGGGIGEVIVSAHTWVGTEGDGKDYLFYTFPARNGAVFNGNPLQANIDGITYTLHGGDKPGVSNISVVLSNKAPNKILPVLGDYDGDETPDYSYYTVKLSEEIANYGFIWVSITETIP